MVRDGAGLNGGFTKRATLLDNGRSVTTQIPLKFYSFLEACENALLPNTKVTFKINFEMDNVLIHRYVNAGQPGTTLASNVIIEDIKLWIPKVSINSSGQRLYMDQYLKNRTWPYLKEALFISEELTVMEDNTWKIMSGVSRPRHLFLWAIRGTRTSTQSQTPLVWNTFDLTGGNPPQRLMQLRLIVGGTENVPTNYYDSSEVPRIYK